jgi:GTPase-associated protein 1, N-terminal domain type 2
VPADQAIFTSLVRRGKSGYHLVSRSPGVSESEANALSTSSPSHGAMLVDEANAQSVNFFPLPSGRYALARTREGCGEYSGRGGRQLFTRVVIVDVTHLRRADYSVFAVYRDALALGHLAYDRNASPTLPRVELSGLFPPWQPPGQLPGMTLSEADSVVAGLAAGRTEVVAYDGDRTAAAEFLLARLPLERALETSFTTNLRPSTVRPYRLCLVARGGRPAY